MTESTPASATPPTALPPHGDRVRDHVEGLRNEVSGEDEVDRRLAEVEMAGEEVAAGWKPAAHPRLSPEIRYLHISRTIHSSSPTATGRWASSWVLPRYSAQRPRRS